MIIISDCLTEKIDEGCLKVANSLTKRIKQKYPDTFVISYGRKSGLSDLHMKLNKMFLNQKLFTIIRKRKEPILYIPFASNTFATALRVFVLSIYSLKSVNVIFALRYQMNILTRCLLKLSRASIIALSKESFEFYRKNIGGRVLYLKTGVDTKKFHPVSVEKKKRIRDKYQVNPEKKVLLHVGHLKNGRNVEKLCDINSQYHVFLVVSSVTEKEQDLREKLDERPDTTIIDNYIENIEELYQMADVYLFPVEKEENCIDVPLSVLEAAACNVPVVTTAYGELKEFKGIEGFRYINSFEKIALNQAVDNMCCSENIKTRNVIQKYDWDSSVDKLMDFVQER